MKTISQRSTKVPGLLVVLAVAALSGCAVTTGGPARPLATGTTLQPNYPVCSGGHASRFPAREEIGRVCRPSASLRYIF